MNHPTRPDDRAEDPWADAEDREEPPARELPDGSAETILEEVMQAYGLTSWPIRHGLRVTSTDDGWAVWGHAEERRVLAAVIADARADGVLDYLHDSGLPGLLSGLARRWVNNPRREDDSGYRWSYCLPDAEGAMAVTEVEPATVSYPPATLADLFAERALHAAATDLQSGLVDHAQRYGGGGDAWLAGYSEGVEHALESLRGPGGRVERSLGAVPRTRAARFLSLLPFGWPRPHTVTLCGSMRFFPQMLEVAAELTTQGVVVLAPFCVLAPAEQRSATKLALDALHRRKIDMSHRIVVVTDNSGYIGESTRAEIAYAERAGKPIDYLTRALTSESA